MARLARLSVPLVIAACVPACASILGIEDLTAGGGKDAGSTPDASVPGNGGSMGSGGGNGSGGSTQNGGAVGSGGGGGVAGSGGAAGNMGSGGAAGNTGNGGAAGNTGNGGTAGGDSGSTITVTGRVIDRWRHPFSTVPIFIGNQTAVTAIDGKFSVANVTVPYSVELIVPRYPSGADGWSFQDLTRSDPTLQVDSELPRYLSDTPFAVGVTGATLPPATNVHLEFRWGSPDGFYTPVFPDNSSSPIVTDEKVYWVGPATSNGYASALEWTVNAATLLPASYQAYDTRALPLADGATTVVAMNLTPKSIANGTFSGTVDFGTVTGGGTAHVYVTGPGSAPIQVVNSTFTGTAFSYLMPKITGATITAFVEAGDTFTPPWAYAHRHGLAPAQTGIALKLAEPAALVLPADSATITSATNFQWNGPDVAYKFLVFFQSSSINNFKILTNKKSAHIPTFPASASFTIPPSTQGNWLVEVEGPFPNTDAASGPEGYVDVADDGDPLSGIDDRDGAGSWSENRSLMSSATP